MSGEIAAGRSHPLGATVGPGGVNFSVYSKAAEAVELLLFDAAEGARPSRVIQLDPRSNHPTFHYWHVYVPGRGTMLVDQVENYWAYLRDIVVPARWSTGNSWKGTFFSILTEGPGALGTGRVSGGSGRYAGMSSEAVESLTARAYSSDLGPVSMDGSLTIVLSPRSVGANE